MASYMSNAIDIIIEAFGGTRPMARAVGKRASSVQYWKDKGFLPRGQRDTVINALSAEGLLPKTRATIVEKAIAGLVIEAKS